MTTVRNPDGSTVTFDNSHFVAGGAEGNVYALRGVGFKIFHDPTRTISAKKIAELQAIKHPRVVIPTGIVTTADRRRDPIGHCFPLVTDAVPLAESFSRHFRRTHGLGPADSLRVVGDVYEALGAIHKANVLVVDLGPMNMLLQNARDVFIIDADSFQTPSFKATAIRDVVRDPLAKSWTDLSDWYSYALLAFQVLIGIHPFQGKHPRGGDVPTRMRNGWSVLDAGATMPAVCDPLTTVPSAYLEWFRALFSNSRRCPPPPLVSAPAVVPAVSTVKTSQKCTYTKIVHTEGDTIRLVLHVDGPRSHVLQCDRSIWVDGVRLIDVDPKASYAVKTVGKKRILLTLKDQKLQALALEGGTCDLSAASQDLGLLMVAPFGRVLARSEDTLFEIKANEFGGKIHFSFALMSRISRHATRLRDRVVVQEIVGGYFFTMFPREDAQVSLSVPELAGKKVLMASASGPVLCVTTMDKKQHTEMHVIRVGEFGKYSIDSRDLPFVAAPNFACLSNGVLVFLNEDGHVELSAPGVPTKKILTDTGLDDQSVFAVDTKLWSHSKDHLYTVTMT